LAEGGVGSRPAPQRHCGRAEIAVRDSGLFVCHALRHFVSPPTCSQDGYDIRTVGPELLGHPRTVATTMIYTHVLNRGGLGVQRPGGGPGVGRVLGVGRVAGFVAKLGPFGVAKRGLTGARGTRLQP